MLKLIALTLLEIVLGALLGEIVSRWLRNRKEKLEEPIPTL